MERWRTMSRTAKLPSLRCGIEDQPERTVALRVEQFGEPRIFLQESEVLVVARVITIFGAQLNRNAKILS